MAGPLLGVWLGAAGIFWLTGGLALAGAVLVLTVVPSPPAGSRTRLLDGAGLLAVLASPRLLRLDLGVFLIHLQLTALFVALPLVLRDQAGIDAARHWQIYIAAILASLLATVPMIRALERGSSPRRLWQLALVALVIGQCVLALRGEWLPAVFAGTTLFFVGFNFVEARLPAEVTSAAPGDRRGAATGVYASSQFLGAFVGGTLGGVLFEWGGARAVFAALAAAAALWLTLVPQDEARG